MYYRLSLMAKYSSYQHHRQIPKCHHQKQVEVAEVVPAYAFPDPGTVVVMANYTNIAV